MPNFRTGLHANDSGAYDQLIKVLRPVIDPGDMLELHQFFVGYGNISAAKALCYPSGDLFIASDSTVFHSLGRDAHGGVRWGAQQTVVSEGFAGIVIGLKGIGRRDHPEDTGTLFIDEEFPRPAGNTVPRLYTEMVIDHAPVEYNLKTRRDIKPGRYFVEFTFAYNDGKSWKTTTKKAEFQVRNFLERYAVGIGVLALLATTLSIARSLIGVAAL